MRADSVVRRRDRALWEKISKPDARKFMMLTHCVRLFDTDFSSCRHPTTACTRRHSGRLGSYPANPFSRHCRTKGAKPRLRV